MSGGPPHHPHNRQVPPTNTAWNHLQGFQVPNFFPRQPQLAHMSNEPSMIHQPTWHTPTAADPLKPSSHLMLNEMLKNESPFPRDCVDLSLTRSDNQNGGPPSQSPISLSVRDTNRINSLPPNELDIQPVERSKSSSPTVKSTNSGVKITNTSFGSSSALSYSGIPGKSTSPGVMSVSSYHKTSSSSPKLSNSGALAATVDLLTSNLGLIEPNFNLQATNNDTTCQISAANSHLLLVNSALAANAALKSTSPNLFTMNPGLLSTSFGSKSTAPSTMVSSYMGLNTQQLPSASLDLPKSLKRSTARVDSILERLNPSTASTTSSDSILNKFERKSDESPSLKKLEVAEKGEQSLSNTSTSRAIIQHSSNFDENSNSNSISIASASHKDEDNSSVYGNDDSLDSNKSRRKRKPSKTIKVPKEDDKMGTVSPVKEVIELTHKQNNQQSVSEPDSALAKDPINIVGKILEDNCASDHQQSADDLAALLPEKPSRKTSSESETIDNIAAMVQEGLQQKQEVQELEKNIASKPETPPIVAAETPKTENNATETSSDSANISNPAKKSSNPHFVEVENKLEEMFAGIEDSSDPLKTDNVNMENNKDDDDDPLQKLEDPPPVAVKSPEPVTEAEETLKEVTSTSARSSPKKNKRKAAASTKMSGEPCESKMKMAKGNSKSNNTKKAAKQQNQSNCKIETFKDVYAYDSGSNASSNKSRGPFIQIRGPRDSPVSVNVINTAQNDDDGERKQNKIKKYHDDIEYRHKVRSKGLHCSTLSNKYDAQTKDASWICAFCKKGPHASDLSSSTERSIPPGDLFGPYFITKQCPEYDRHLDNPLDKQFKSKKIGRLIDENPLLKVPSSKKAKRKTLDYDSNIYLGITETGNKTFEVWAHEDCIVWSSGTYLVGPKIIGLEEAVWSSCAVSCINCQRTGANIFCLKRGCLSASHVDCARNSGWMLMENSFKAYCQEHGLP